MESVKPLNHNSFTSLMLQASSVFLSKVDRIFPFGPHLSLLGLAFAALSR